jgi:hypothetical protein
MSMEGLARVQHRIAELTNGNVERPADAARGAPFASVLASAMGAGDAPAPAITGTPAAAASSLPYALTTLGAMVAGPLVTSARFATATGAIGTGAPHRSGAAIDATGVPADLATFGNGRVPEGALVAVEGADGDRLWGPAAGALAALRDDAAAAGVRIGVTSGYRSYDEQVAMAAEKGLYRQGGLAAEPGHSQHGWGLAVDLDVDEAGLTWLRAHAERYGFAESVAGEPWHWEFRPAG